MNAQVSFIDLVIVRSPLGTSHLKKSRLISTTFFAHHLDNFPNNLNISCAGTKLTYNLPAAASWPEGSSSSRREYSSDPVKTNPPPATQVHRSTQQHAPTRGK